MPTEQVALAHYRRRKRLIDAAARDARRAWRALRLADLDGTWGPAAARLLIALTGAQAAAAAGADAYLDQVLAAQDIPGDAAGAVRGRLLAGVASDGRPLDTLLRQPLIATKVALAAGRPADRALAAGYATLDMIARTQVADAGRAADQVALVARPAVTGYRRMVVGRTCARCTVLAGAWYRWNAGFNRHPRCDCVGVPAQEDTGRDVSTNPAAYFGSLDRADQDEIFGRAGAEAIREGADIGQVVNARRGMKTAADGRIFTREAAGRRVRLMPEQIFRDARGSREEAIRLLRLHGYLI